MNITQIELAAILHPVLHVAFLFAGLFCQPPPAAPDAPNILWITAEDMSPVLGYLGDEYAITPNIDRLAGEKAALKDPSEIVRIEAASALLKHDHAGLAISDMSCDTES